MTSRCGAERERRLAAASAVRARLLLLVLVAAGCSETLDAGYNHPGGNLPVDSRNPIVLLNDGAYENWFGEYAVLLANGGGSPLAGIVVNANADWPDLQTNVGGYQALVTAARASGLQNLPDPIGSAEVALVKPASGVIDDTQPNRSTGASFIVDASNRLALPHRPLVIATGGALTDVADAYLIDHTVTQRVVIVASLGMVTSDGGGGMGIPNGDRDPWADFIVVSRFTYVQVSAWYDQLTDVPMASLNDLPKNDLGNWIAAKQPNLWQWSPASDQVAVLAVGLPGFATTVQRVAAPASLTVGSTNGPDLAANASGSGWLVTACDGAAATAQFWHVLGTTR